VGELRLERAAGRLREELPQGFLDLGDLASAVFWHSVHMFAHRC
jgi:hypothetical protein